ncbi:MAG: carbon starvation CstA family protein [Merdibacter sp.]
MNGLLLLGIACVILIAAYLLYGRYLVKTWGIDPNAVTPAVEKEDGSRLRATAINGRCSCISFHPSPALVRSPVRSWR